MRMLAFLVALLMGATSFAGQRSIEAIVGGVTTHVIDNGTAQHYDNKISDGGRVILTPTLGARIVHTPGNYSYSSAAIFRSTSSVGSPTYGGLLSSGIAFGPFFLGLGLGAYVQNNEDFRAKGIEPYSMVGNTNAVVPLAGAEFNVRIPVSDNNFISFNNLLTPIITNHNLGYGWYL